MIKFSGDWLSDSYLNYVSVDLSSREHAQKMMVIVSLYPLLWISWLFMTGVLVDAQRLFNMESMRSRQPLRLPSSFQTVDSYNETITVFNMTTTVSPNEETATKVSVETIDTLLEALDGAASAIDGQHFSTGILGDFTTQRVPGTILCYEMITFNDNIF